MPSSPTQPEPAESNGTLPELSPAKAALLDAFITARFDLLTLASAARLSATQLTEFATDPELQAHVAALISLARQGLHLRASRARHAVIEALESLATSADSPVEQRRAAALLLRATTAPVIAAAAPAPRPAPTGQGNANPEPEPQPETTAPPRPRALPHPCFTPDQVARLILDSVVDCDEPDYSSGAATIAGFLDSGASIDNQPLPAPATSTTTGTTSLEEHIQAIEASPPLPVL